MGAAPPGPVRPGRLTTHAAAAAVVVVPYLTSRLSPVLLYPTPALRHGRRLCPPASHLVPMTRRYIHVPTAGYSSFVTESLAAGVLAERAPIVGHFRPFARVAARAAEPSGRRVRPLSMHCLHAIDDNRSEFPGRRRLPDENTPLPGR